MPSDRPIFHVGRSRDRAIRVYLTHTELEELIAPAARGEPATNGHEVEAIALPPPDRRPGLILTITGRDVPLCAADEQPTLMTLTQYRELYCTTQLNLSSNLGLQESFHLPSRDMAAFPLPHPPAGENQPADWPKFPGEDLGYQGEHQPQGMRVRGAVHTGGPR